MDVNVMKSHTLLALLLLVCLVSATLAYNATLNVNVGLVLNLGTPNGKMWQSCINLALSDFYASRPHYRTRLILHTRDSNNDAVGAAAAALDLIENEQVEAIMGPQTSTQAKFVINLGKKAQVPIVTFSATSPSLRSIRSDYFIRAAQNDSSQVQAIRSLVKHLRWKEAVVIYEDTEYGEGIIPYLNDALQDVDARVSYRTALHPNLSDDDEIEKELHKLMTMPTRVFIVHVLPPLGSRLFTKAKQIGMMKAGYVWIVTNGIADQLGSVDPIVLQDSMQGVLGIKTHIPQRKALEDFKGKWKRRFDGEAEIDVFGLWAHDTAVALARAVDKSSLVFQGKSHAPTKADVVMGLESIGVSQNGPKLLQELKRSHFRGLSGDFCLVNGELQPSTFQIVNIKGSSFEGIGFWKPFNTLKVNVGDILWPGRSTNNPKGWDGKRLKIGVPKAVGFTEFVNVTGNNSINANVTGYCIDVFKAVIKELPYEVVYDFFPFVKPNGERAGNYNDLVYQVFVGAYDAVVGDVSILANRSEYVDFTLPYTASAVSMIVPLKGEKRNPWAFFKPLTWDMWATSVCFFLFIGFIVWVLEHRKNPDFRGPPSYQVGTSVWFSFSTMLFTHRETVVGNLTRFVMIIWCFVVLILTQSYTASLASLLTVENLQPAVTDVYQLLKNGDYVGYLGTSFVLELLKEMGFHESKLRPYSSSEECHELFTRGSANGGIAAAFDETPYMNIFLAQHSSKYTMVKPKFRTGGFGFVFPKGSPLVADISRAILNVTQGDKMAEIERAWLKSAKGSCLYGTSTGTMSSSSSSLGLDSFWGLFVIAGGVASFAVIIFAVIFLYEHGYDALRFNSESSIWTRIGLLWRSFDEKDLRSRAFNTRREEGEARNEQGMCVDEVSNFGASPLSINAESHFGSSKS